MSRGAGSKIQGPKVGTEYVVQEDGSLENVGTVTYGDPAQAANIVWGNPGVVSSGSTIKKGTKLIIPGEPPPIQLTDREPDDLTIILGGYTVPLENARIIRTMDTACDGWTCKFPWEPGKYPDFDKVIRPFGYSRAAAYIGNELQVNGCIYNTMPEMTKSGIVMGLKGFSYTADAVDSHVTPPYEFNNVTLKQLADHFLPPLGIDGIWQCDPGKPFARVCAHESDTIFVFLSKLATERGILISCTPDGNMLFLQATTDLTPVGTISEDTPGVVEWKADYDGRKRFRFYKCITSGAKQGAQPDWHHLGQPTATQAGPSIKTEVDEHVPKSRTMVFRADNTVPNNIADAARWRKNREFISALTIPFPVSSWYAPNGKLWAVNTIVTVVSKVLGVPNGYNFLIRSVEFELEKNRRHAMLHVLPPQAFTNKDVGEVWQL